MFCKKCGAQLSDDSDFCYHCGCKLKETESDAAEKETEVSDSSIECEGEQIAPPPENRFKKMYEKIADKLFLAGFISAAFGTVLFLGIVLVSLIGWRRVYLYGGYGFTAVLTTFSLIFMIIGFVVLTAVFALDFKFKSSEWLTRKTFKRLSAVLMALCIGLSVWGFVDYANENDHGSSYGNGSYSGGYNDNYSSGVNKQLGLSLKVDSIKTKGNYTYVYCTVTNVSSKYVATKYRFVKVKAQFKNRSGTIIDSDWTYAVDSTWLEPGESKTFYYMVSNTNITSATLSFID